MHTKNNFSSSKMRTIFLIVLSFVSVKCSVIVPPEVTYITPDQVKSIGESVDFECTVKNGGEYPRFWAKLDNNPLNTEFLTIESEHIIKDPRYEVNNETSTYKLRINNLQDADFGRYRCVVLVSITQNATADVSLSEWKPPVIKSSSTQSLFVPEGDSIQMECYAEGYPMPTVTWHRRIKESDDALHIGTVLEMNAVKEFDSGEYYCLAENGGEKSDRRDFQLKIESDIASPTVSELRKE